MPKLMIDTSRRKTGALLTLISIASYSMMNIFAAMNSRAVSVIQQTFFRSVVSAFIIGGLIIVRWMSAPRGAGHSRYGDWRKYFWQMTGRSLFGLLGMSFAFFAVRGANKADVAIVSQTSMFIVPIISLLLFGERPSGRCLAAMLIAFGGVLTSANPSFDSSSLPMLAALGSAAANSGAFMMLSYFSGRVEPLAVILHFCIFSTVASAPFALQSFIVPSAHDIFCLIMIGVCGAVTQSSMTYAYRFATATEIGVYNQLTIPMSALTGSLFLGEVPGIRTLIGASAVIAASLMLITGGRAKR